jgi:hypothetical protein
MRSNMKRRVAAHFVGARRSPDKLALEPDAQAVVDRRPAAAVEGQHQKSGPAL